MGGDIQSQPEVLRVSEAAAYLGLCGNSVCDDADREIPHRHVGRRILFHRPALQVGLRGGQSRAA